MTSVEDGLAMRLNVAKVWRGNLLNGDLSSSNVWVICGAGAAVLVLPRLLPLWTNFLFYDDYVVVPIHHLRLHRFVEAAELAFWSWVYGPGYLLSYIPKLVSLGYIMAGVWAMAQIFRAWNVPFLTALVAVLLFLMNPILTDFFVWNDISSDNLAWAFVLLGYLVQLHTQRYALAGGVALGFLALGTYQAVVGLPAMLVAKDSGIMA